MNINYERMINERLPNKAQVEGAELRTENKIDVLRVYYRFNNKEWSTPIKLTGERTMVINRRREMRYR